MGALICSAGLCLGTVPTASAQRYSWHDNHLDFRRNVEVIAEAEAPLIVVTDFFCHGQRTAMRPGLAVYEMAKSQLIPSRWLQVGPGDLCRVAFETSGKKSQYLIYYGGEQEDPAKTPAWTETAGLLLETRRWKSCNLHDPNSVREAFQASEPIGSDYVAEVYHRQNPFDIAPAPFLSRYSGTLHVPTSGKYHFFTSSQDCSFLSIDGQPVVASPGRHGPVHQARFRGEVMLQAGPHPLEYLHAAQSDEACMVAAWQPPDANLPARIPPDRFRYQSIAHLPSDPLESRDDRYLPDFRMTIAGEVPLTDDSILPGSRIPEVDIPWLVRIQFSNRTAKAIAAGTRFQWDFGDGQTSNEPEPTHVYLHPGLYQISLSARHRGKQLVITNKVWISRQTCTESVKTDDSLADYLPRLFSYDPAKLDSDGVFLLMRAFLEAKDSEKAAAVGQAAFLADDPNKAGDPSQALGPQRDDAFRWNLAGWLGPILRDQRNDPHAALAVWRDSSEKIHSKEWAAACAIEAADIALNELLLRDQASPLLEFAIQRIRDQTGETASQLHRVRGDWFARAGMAEEAQAAYLKATEALQTKRQTIEQNAWRGARSRSTEAFLRDQHLDQARDELRAWLREFPGDRGHGYLSLLQARYWIARNNLPAAIAMANDLLVLNPNSSYADQLLFLSAICEEKCGNSGRAITALESLVTEYPGSPLTEKAKTQLAEWKEKE